MSFEVRNRSICLLVIYVVYAIYVRPFGHVMFIISIKCQNLRPNATQTNGEYFHIDTFCHDACLAEFEVVNGIREPISIPRSIWTLTLIESNSTPKFSESSTKYCRFTHESNVTIKMSFRSFAADSNRWHFGCSCVRSCFQSANSNPRIFDYLTATWKRLFSVTFTIIKRTTQFNCEIYLFRCHFELNESHAVWLR